MNSMATTETVEVNGITATNYPGQAHLTVGDVRTFLKQFPADQEIGWYLIAEDATPHVGLFADHNTHPEPGEAPIWPMIVTSFVPHEDVI